MRHGILITLLAVEVAAFSAIEGLRFADAGGPALYFAEHIRRPLFDHAPLLLLSLAMAVTVWAGGIDLSLAAIAAAVGCAMSLAPGGPAFWYTAVPAGLAMGAAMGAMNGALAGRSRGRAALVTLIAMAAYRGLAYAMTAAAASAGRPSPFGMVDDYDWLSAMPGLVIVVVGSYAAAGLLLRYRPWARRLAELANEHHAPPSHEASAVRVRIAAYAAAGLIAAMAGVMHTAQTFEAGPLARAGDETWAVAAVVLAGAFGVVRRARVLAVFIAGLAVAVFIEMFIAVALRWPMPGAGADVVAFDWAMLRWPVMAAAAIAIYRIDRRRAARTNVQ